MVPSNSARRAENTRAVLREESRAFRLDAPGSPRRRRPRRSSNIENLPPPISNERAPRQDVNRQAANACIGFSNVSNSTASVGTDLVPDQSLHPLQISHSSDNPRPLQDITTEATNQVGIGRYATDPERPHLGERSDSTVRSNRENVSANSVSSEDRVVVTLPRRPAPLRLIFNFSRPTRPSIQERERQRRTRIHVPSRQLTPELITPPPSQAHPNPASLPVQAEPEVLIENQTHSGYPTQTAQTLGNSRSRRSLAQQARRLRERMLRQQQLLSQDCNTQPEPTPRVLAQRARRLRERTQRQQQLPSPDPTQVGRVLETFQLRPNHLTEPIGGQPVPVQNSDQSSVPLARRAYTEPTQRHDLGRMDQECKHCGALHWLAEKLASSSKRSPEFVTCCDHGTVQLPDLPPPPPQLEQLFIGMDDQSKNFRDLIWNYNRALSFTSLGVKEDHSINCGRGEPVFRIHGELCHRSGSLLPHAGHQPTYAQLYVIDSREALQQRMANNSDSPNVREDTMALLQDILRENHQYAAVYMHAYEILRNRETEDICIRLRVAPGNQKRYSLPTADEVAVVLPGDQSSVESRDIILRTRSGPLQQISECHPAYSPLQYVLLFPHGEAGWHPQMQIHDPHSRRPKRKRVTMTRHTAYRIHDRRREFSCLLRGGRLLQRYLVDMWAAADQNNLRYLRLNNDKFRMHVCQGLEDAIDNDEDLNNIGTRTILPSSYIGGPRHMQQRFQDSLAIARYFKKVDIFLTMTCNPQWPEITRELRPHETSYDRPDLVARVFQMKKKALLKDILDCGVLGKTVAHVYTIEFQKRGLPHMHLLLFFDNPHKLYTPEEIDKLISAKWPDPVTEPLLFETVKTCMVHGPCGAANPNAPCMDKETNTCTKHFPKQFTDHTNMDVNGYPEYYRPDDGRVYMVGDRRPLPVDNRWIVPYCPYLSAKFNCHINVECAVSLSSFKYIFKYIQKGGDRARMELYRHDEITRWIDGRYISASEATWRTLHFDVHDQNPSITRLQVHLPGHHNIIFNPNDDPEQVRQRALSERSTLTAFFEANADDGALGEEARKFTYQEFPQHFTWVRDGSRSHWKIRQRDFALGRMYFVPPTAGERFYLRTLLTVVKGPKSFEDLRTYNGTTYGTFQEACIARGLLEDDGEWEQCLCEASHMQTGTQLRSLFVTLLLFCDVSNPNRLWSTFREHICDDLHHRLQILGFHDPSEELIYDYGLYLINKILGESGRALTEWPLMPKPQRNWDEQGVNPLIVEQLDYNHEAERHEFEARLPMLNADQRLAYNTIIESIENHNPGLFFLDGPGGTGKTYVYITMCHKLRSEGHIVLAVASSGIAALLLPGGRTAHSLFKIPLNVTPGESVCNIPKNSLRADLLRRTTLIIWDEAGAQNRAAFEAVDKTLRDIRGCALPFGGITVLLGGDFQQTLPVVPQGNPADIINATIQRSYLWDSVQILRLRENMRLTQATADRTFANWLLNVGHGREGDEVALSNDLLCETPEDLINFIYPAVGTSPPPPRDYFSERMILAPRNSDVSDINSNVLEKMHGESRTYFSADKLIREAGADQPDDYETQPIPVEYLREINETSLPPGELTLKKGCPIILLRNLNPSHGLCNGTRLIVTQMSDRVLEAQIMGGSHDGKIVFIPRITLTPQQTSAHYAFKFSRRQFPVRLAFALTINKSQGQSVRYVGLDLRIPAFSHGQLYVAFSRVTSSRNVRVLLHTGHNSTTRNVVYPEVLLDLA